MSNKLGVSYLYMMADKTAHPWADSPIQADMPIYLGNPGVSAPLPDQAYIHRHTSSGRDVGYKIDSILSPEDPINPFKVPLVMLVRFTS